MDCVPPWDESCALAVTSPNRVARVNNARKDLMGKNIFFINAMASWMKVCATQKCNTFAKHPDEERIWLGLKGLRGKVCGTYRITGSRIDILEGKSPYINRP